MHKRRPNTLVSRAFTPLVSISRAHVTRETGNATPPPAVLIEARHAKESSWEHPLRYMLGEPLPGRSALDKQRSRS